MKLYHENGNGEKTVSWTIFVWAMGFVLATFSVLSATTYAFQGKLATHNETQQIDMVQIKTQLSQIQADLQWLKNNVK